MELNLPIYTQHNEGDGGCNDGPNAAIRRRLEADSYEDGISNNDQIVKNAEICVLPNILYDYRKGRDIQVENMFLIHFNS